MAAVYATGDLVLGNADVGELIAPASSELRKADLVIGHVELPHTSRGELIYGLSAPAAPLPPERLEILKPAGIGLATLGGNHIFDAGPLGVMDTISTLDALEIPHCGAGATLVSAWEPAIVDVGGVRVGVLSLNCVGPKQSWASATKAGAAYVEVITHYENTYESPGGPPDRTFSFATPETQRRMEDAIGVLRQQVHVVVVALHKGIGHIPAVLAMYERPLSHAAVDAGADVVLGHHAHILRGIEVYRGRPIYHGLGNFLTVTNQLSVDPAVNSSPERLAWARKRRELFGFEPDPSYPNYPFHPEARYTFAACFECDQSGVHRAGFVPFIVDKSGAPIPVSRQNGGEAVLNYVAEISERAGLSPQLEWDGDRVILQDIQHG